jgi:hypothetical protein
MKTDTNPISEIKCNRSLLSNLNVFIACFILLAMFAAGPIIMIVSLLLAPVGQYFKGHAGFMYPVAHFSLTLPLIFFWWKTGLSPTSRNPERQRRYLIGHWMVGITNLMTTVALTLPFLLAHFSGNSNLVMLAWIAFPVYAFGFLFFGIGLFLIWSSRA